MEAKIAGAKKLGLRVLSKDGAIDCGPLRSEHRDHDSGSSGFIVDTDVTANPTANAAAPPGLITSVTVYPRCRTSPRRSTSTTRRSASP
jgi:hypothetical protein